MSISRTIHSLSSQIPEGDVFGSVSKGFQSFWKIQRNDTSPERHTIDHSFNNEIEGTLDRNKQKLHILRRQIEKKRDESYEKYIQNNSKYQRLMQINTMKKKLVSTLNKNIGEVKIKSLQQLSGLPVIYEYHASVVNTTGCKPQPRTGQVCLYFKDNILVLGGHNSTPLKPIWSFNIKQSTWVKLEPSQLVRSGHSILIYKNKYAVVFGGMSFYNPFTLQRQCENTVCYFYDITSGTPKTVKAINSQIVQPRKDHSAIIFGYRMIVFGGCSKKKQYLSDLLAFDFKTMKWSVLQYQGGSQSASLFFRQGISQAVFGQYFKNKNSTKLASVSYTDEEGLYIFGGVNGQGQSHKLSQIRMNRRIPIIHRLYPEGVGPSYISSSVVCYRQDTFMILSGDRGCRQLYLYEALCNKYTKVQCGGMNIKLGGIGSSLVEKDGTYYILFGIGESGFSSDIVSFTLKIKKNTARKRPKANSLHKLSNMFSNWSQKGSDYI